MNICIPCPEGHPVLLAGEKLGQMVACPRCFATFVAEWEDGTSIGARKVSRARDDDDEEDERPKKKPVAKKVVKRRDDDDDDEDDEDDDDDATEEEEPEIEWTGRKRQLHKCGIGLIIMMVAFYMLLAMVVALVLPMIYFMFEVGNKIGNTEKLAEPKANDWFWVGLIVAIPAALALTTLVVGLFFNFFVPARVEARGMVLCALIFAGIVYLLGTIILISDSIGDSADSLKRLMGILAGICLVVSFMSAMAYLAKLMTFMKLHLEASQPITNMGFFLLYFVAMFAIFFTNSYICYYIFWFACFATIVALFAAAGMAARALIAQALLFLRVRRVITKFIRDD